MDNVPRYRKYAIDCLQIAQDATDPTAKLALLDMAQVWILLAEKADRNDGPLSETGKPEVVSPPE